MRRSLPIYGNTKISVLSIPFRAETSCFQGFQRFYSLILSLVEPSYFKPIRLKIRLNFEVAQEYLFKHHCIIELRRLNYIRFS